MENANSRAYKKMDIIKEYHISRYQKGLKHNEVRLYKNSGVIRTYIIVSYRMEVIK